MPDQPTNGIICSTDMALVAFYIINGLELVGVDRRNTGNSVDCTFRLLDPKHEAEALRIKWASSVEQRFDSQLRSLRKIVTETRRERR